MSAPHFFTTDVSGDVVVIEGDDAHHAGRVLRITPGETITVSNGDGEVVTATVKNASKTLEAQVTARESHAAPRPRITVYQALAKHPKLDDVVARLTELGVSEIIPFAGARSIARWDARKAEAQHARLNTIAKEAAMQSRRAFLPRVRALVALDDIPRGALILHEEATMRMSEALPAHAPPELAIVVGPEGGLEPEEVSALTKRGGVVVSLGEGILRTETAGFAAVCVAHVRFGLLG